MPNTEVEAVVVSPSQTSDTMLVETIYANAGVENQTCKQSKSGTPQTLHVWRHNGVVYKLKFDEYESLMEEKGLSILYMAEKEENERTNAKFEIYD